MAEMEWDLTRSGTRQEREGSGSAEPAPVRRAESVCQVDEVGIKPMPKQLSAATGFVRFLCKQKTGSCLIDWDAVNRCEIRRTRHLPVMHRLWVHPTGYSLGYAKGRSGTPQAYFLSPHAEI
jgi:hypothetical protein